MKHLASYISLSRVFIAIIMYVYITMIHASSVGALILLLCFVLVELSDLLDGMVARKLGIVSDLGKLLDPLCDVTAHFLCMYALTQVGLAPRGVVVIFVLREVWMQMFRSILIKRNIVLAARWSGKVKTWCYGIAVGASVLIYPYSVLADYAVELQSVVFCLYYIAAGMSIISALHYVWLFVAHRSKLH